MANTFIIVWKSKSRASVGRGKALFSSEEAERTAKELNEEYPDFVHEPLDVSGPCVIAEPQLPEPAPEQSLIFSAVQQEVSA